VSSHPTVRLLYSMVFRCTICSATDMRLPAVSPEKYATSDCTRMLDTMYKRGNLNRLVVDEVGLLVRYYNSLILPIFLQAHCISQWGHSFRSEYRGLGKFRARYGDIPIMALTATATQVYVFLHICPSASQLFQCAVRSYKQLEDG
jgi:hypothetical protein